MLIIRKTITLILIYLLWTILASLTLNVAQAEAPIRVATYPDGLEEYKHYAYDQVSETWGTEQWEYFNDLITRESGWNNIAQNPTSSAYGLCQTMMSLHEVPEGFRTSPELQIDWCVNYVEKRYNTPKEAIIFHNANNYF